MYLLLLFINNIIFIVIVLGVNGLMLDAKFKVLCIIQEGMAQCLTLLRRCGEGEGTELRRLVVGDCGLCPLSLRCLWVRTSPRPLPRNPLSRDTAAESENTDSSSDTCSFSSSRLIFCRSDTAETPESVSVRPSSEHRHRIVSRR